MYVAFFCPHCGNHLNEDELDDDHNLPSAKYGPQHGLVNCGWCHEKGVTYSHVIRCRIANKSISELRMKMLAADLDVLRLELEAQIEYPDLPIEGHDHSVRP